MLQEWTGSGRVAAGVRQGRGRGQLGIRPGDKQRSRGPLSRDYGSTCSKGHSGFTVAKIGQMDR